MWEQKIAIFLKSLLFLIKIFVYPVYIGLINPAEKEMWTTKGFWWRVRVSIIVAFGIFIFLIYWLWSLTKHYIIYKNLAIVIFSHLITGGILATK